MNSTRVMAPPSLHSDEEDERRFEEYYERGGQGLADDVWRRITRTADGTPR